ncbi:SDR family oxidoreductase [Gordonia liuliyuniae]|uniref:SDR family oxidoreductase n=1 Tax=Gordonia liuliyuniae TaxID=2911517 RepID=A0ABS9IQJ4_9ACTN|nr:SDR family oxidoreductase [Gordonia liuliyuniae]MCF8587822.1 SDR family oxidoreductase [Gordonia liuliyuniae]
MNRLSKPVSRRRPVVVVTGGTAGVGRAAARIFADRGYDVAVLARGRAGLDATRADLEERGAAVWTQQTDVAEVAQVEAAADAVEAELGPIDVWVNNAFAGALSLFRDTTADEFRRMTDVTYLGQVNGTRAALTRMRTRDRGVIVNVASAMSFRAIPLQSAYCGAKHAIKGFTESLITELRNEGSGVSVGLITLPGLNTPQFDWNLNKMPRHPMPVPPVYQPEVAARAIADTARRPRRNRWVGVPTVYTVLGNRLAPGVMDWYLARYGVRSQQTARLLPDHGANLYRAQDEDVDRGARGQFDDLAHPSDPVSFIGRHRTLAALAASAVPAGGLAVAARMHAHRRPG